MELPGYRGNIIELLQTIASAEKTREYAKGTPGGDVLGELICEWFDDLYLPEKRHNEVVSAETLARYKSQFYPAELDAMERFNNFFDGRLDSLGKHDSAHTLLIDPVWRDIMGQAAIALRSFKMPG